MSETGNAVAKKLRSDRCEERWPCSVEFCACNALDEGADEIDRLCRALDEMQNMLRDSEARLAEVEARYARAEKAIELADDQLTELAEIVYQYVDPFDVAPEHVDAVRRATALAQTTEKNHDDNT